MPVFHVVLHRMARWCGTCGAPIRVSTSELGSVSEPSCSPYRCRIARTIALAGNLPGGEIQEQDDRRASRARHA